MVALWLVEGLRKGSGFPSHNALCLPEDALAGNWAEISEKNHQKVQKAYQGWWKRVQALTAEEAKKIEPLAGSCA